MLMELAEVHVHWLISVLPMLKLREFYCKRVYYL
jgi:hypothetical protein